MRLLPAITRIVLPVSILAALPSAARAGSAMEWQARGVQIYACTPDGPAFAWRLKAPDAVLLNVQGQQAGRHFAGPSWQAKDGSVVVGEVVASGSGDAGAIPWLLLRAKSRTGEGLFARIGYIVRSRTAGGVAPGSGCDRDHAGTEARVDYIASYTFLPEPAEP